MLTSGMEGVSVTVPHKQSVLGLMDSVDPVAKRLGAVNTIVRRGRELRGFNTDAEAALAPLRAALPLAGRRVAVLGAGGAARALAFTLPAAGCRLKIFNRSPERASALAREAGVQWGPWETLEREPYDVLVQTTPVGMHPRVDETPIPEEWLRGSLIYDVIYNPAETRLLRAARRRGIATLGGGEMFLGQAAAQFRLFTGSEPPLSAWRSRLAQALSENPA
jgi:shikimate dehydrogenase